MIDEAAKNTDYELYRDPDKTGNGDYYSPSIHVNDSGGIGINVGGQVYVKSLREWHALAVEEAPTTFMTDDEYVNAVNDLSDFWSPGEISDSCTVCNKKSATLGARALTAIFEGTYTRDTT